MTEYAIEANQLSKSFMLNQERRMAFKELVVRGRPKKADEFWALRDATFKVAKGSMFGLVGHNGSGKSTALKVIAGIYRPTSGSVQVRGRLSALLELGAGFHPELTGRENIVLNASILGMTKKQIEANMDEIIEFAGLGRFIDSPIKVYSSGMYVRLGFAIAVKVDPEVLVIDEVIAVGDEDFQRKCFDYIDTLRNRGSTIVMVTHSMGIITDLCDNAMWLDHGNLKAIGNAREVVDAYLGNVNEAEASREINTYRDHDMGNVIRRGTGEARVTGVGLLADEKPLSFATTNNPVTIRVELTAPHDIHEAVVGIGFTNETGIVVAGPNTIRIGPITIPEGKSVVDFQVDNLILTQGNYRVSTAIVVKGTFLDSLENVFEMTVRARSADEPGLVSMPGTWVPPRGRTELDPSSALAISTPRSPAKENPS